MAKTPYRDTLIYNTVEKVEAYWNSFKPTTLTTDSYKDKWISHSSLFDTISLQSRVCVTLWDAASSQFIYACDKTNVLGDSAAQFTKSDGVDRTYANMKEKHRQANLVMQEKGINYCIQHKEHLPYNITMNADFAYNKNGNYIHILQQVTVIETTADKHPLLFLSYIYDITHLKKPESANLVITAPHETLIWNYDFDNQQLKPAKPLTEQEKKVLYFLGEAKHTKEIAHALSITAHTANKHRSNLLAKTNCIDSTGMVTYCRMVGLM